MFEYIENNLIEINDRINKAKLKRDNKNINLYDLDPEVKLLAVTKTVEPEKINYAISKGVNLIGENRVNELLEKYDKLNRENLSIHFIGNLQTNKVKYIIDKVDMIQSVNSLKLAEEINKRAAQHNIIMDVLIEINIGNENTKIGINPKDTENFILSLENLENIRVKGLMAIPPVCANCTKKVSNNAENQEETEIIKYFREVNKIFVDISVKKIDNIYKKDKVDMRILSIGMSNDFEQAIACNSNIVRIGTAIFGQRL